MHSTVVTVASRVGLHSRPARIIAEIASRFEAPVFIHLVGEGTEAADATSSLMIMALGIEHGDTVEVQSSDPTAAHAVAEAITRDFDEKNKP